MSMQKSAAAPSSLPFRDSRFPFDPRDAVLAHLRHRHLQLGHAGVFSAQTLVFESALLDSMGLLDLVSVVEAASGVELDMLRFDPGAVSTVDDLIAQLQSALQG